MKADKETCGKKIQTQLKKKKESPEFFDTDSEDSHNDDEEQKPVTKSYTH